MQYRAFKLTNLSLTLGFTFLCFSIAEAQLPNSVSYLSTRQVLNIYTGKEITMATLMANDQNLPPLITTQKKSIQLVDPASLQSEQRAYLQTLIDGRDLNKFYLVDYFAHGYEKMKKASDIELSLELMDKAKLWLALIPKDVVVKNIYLQTEWFKEGVGGHAQIRYQLNQDITLIDRALLTADAKTQLKNLKLQDFTKTDWKTRFLTNESVIKIPGDITFTLMAIRYEGGPEDWGAISGLTGAFANALTFTSTDHIAVMQGRENFIEQLQLNNAKINGTKTLHYALNYSNGTQEKEIYHLIFNSCINASLRVLASAYKDINIFKFNPYTFSEQFAKLKTSQQPQSLNQEYETATQVRYIAPKVAPYLNIIQSPQFEVFVQQFAYKNLDLNYEEMSHLFEIGKILIFKIKAGQLDPLNKKQIEAEVSKYMMDNKIPLTPDLKAKLDRKSQEMLALAKENLNFLILLMQNVIKTQN